jgi:hypothetical protein
MIIADRSSEKRHQHGVPSIVSFRPTNVNNVLIPEGEILLGEIEDSPVPTYSSLITKEGARKVQQINRHMLALLQLTNEEVKKEGFKIAPFFHPDDAIRVEAAIQKSIHHLEPFKEEFRIVLRNGT